MRKRRTASPVDLRFFCENCGEEVPRDADSCPGCGRRFQSVRCPACDFVGEQALFKNGCPVCGHLPGTPAPVSGGSAVSKKNSGKRRTPNAAPREDGKPTGALPFWVYVLVAAAFTIVFTALFLKLM